jgi:DNA-binding SARP family transcriptional activator
VGLEQAAAPRLEVRLFGEPSLRFDGQPLLLKAPRRCFAILALISRASGDPPTRLEIAFALWPDLSENEALANLRRHLHLLHKTLPAIEGVKWIETGRLSVAWNSAAPLWVDLRAFEGALADPERRREAIELYRGPLLGTLDEPAILSLRDRARAACAEACREEALAARRQFDYGAAIRYAERMLAVDEQREDALRLAMTFRYESGDRTSALALFERFAAHLRDQLGIDPMPETLALRDDILMNREVSDAGAGDGEHAPAEDATPCAPFVGRRREMAALQSAWERVRRGKGAAMLLTGAAGIGKTRLLAEFAMSTGLQGGRSLLGETSHPERQPYEPFVDALRKGMALIVETPIGNPWLSSLAELLPELRAAFPDVAEAAPLEPAIARNRLLEAIARAIERLARVRPLLLVLEDLHHAGRATLDALEALVRRIGAVACLVVVTFRSGESAPDSPLLALRRRLLQEDRAQSLDLQALDAADIDTLLQRSLQGDVPDGVAAAVYGISEGNPLFAAQLVRVYTETGALPPRASESTLAKAILANVEALGGRAREAIGGAAAIGRTFTLDALGAVLGWPEGDAIDAIGELIDRALVRASGAGTFSYAFSHELIARNVYEHIPERTRVLLHRRIAAVLSATEGAEVLALASIARHWEMGGDAVRAGLAYSRGAKAAVDAYALHEGIDYARSALRFITDPAAVFEMRRLIAVAQAKVMDRERWFDDLQELTAVAETLGASESFLALQQWCQYHSGAGDESAERHVTERMLALAERLDASTVAKAQFARGMLEYNLGRYGDAIDPYERAVAAAAEAGDAQAEAWPHCYLAEILWSLGREREALEHFERLCELAETEHPSTELRTIRLKAQGTLAITRSDVTLARRTGEEMLELALRAGDQMLELMGMHQISFAHRWTGSLKDIRDGYARSAQRCREMGYRRGAVIAETNRATVESEFGLASSVLDIVAGIEQEARQLGDAVIDVKLLCNRATATALMGNLDDAVPFALAAFERSSRLDRRIQGQAQLVLGTVRCERGESGPGIDALELAVACVRETGSESKLLEYLARLVIALAGAGRLAEMSEAATELAELDKRYTGKLWITHPTSIAYALGLAAERTGNRARAGAFYAKGLAALRREFDRLGDEARPGLERFAFNRALMATAESTA